MTLDTTRPIYALDIGQGFNQCFLMGATQRIEAPTSFPPRAPDEFFFLSQNIVFRFFRFASFVSVGDKSCVWGAAVVCARQVVASTFPARAALIPLRSASLHLLAKIWSQRSIIAALVLTFRKYVSPSRNMETSSLNLCRADGAWRDVAGSSSHRKINRSAAEQKEINHLNLILNTCGCYRGHN